MRGVSALIVTILLLMMSVSLASMGYIFITQSASETIEAAETISEQSATNLLSEMKIDSITDNVVQVKNTGKTTISNFAVYVNEMPVSATSDPTSIEPGSIAEITLSSTPDPGDVVKVTSAQGSFAIKSVPGAVVCLPDGCNGICPSGCNNPSDDEDCGCVNDDSICCLDSCNPGNDNDCVGGPVGFWSFSEGFVRDDDNERDNYASGDGGDDGANKWLIVDTSKIQGQYASLYIYGMARSCNSTADSDYRLRVNDVTAQTINLNWCNIFGLDTGSTLVNSGWNWVRIDIPKSWLINGENKFNFWDTGGLCSWNCANWQIGVDTDNYYTRSGWCCNCGLGTNPPKGSTGTCGATSNGELMMYLSFTGNKTFDSINFNNGTIGVGVSGDIRAPTFANGMYDSGLGFDGLDNYVRIDDASTLDMTDELTISAWIYPNSFGSSGYGRIIDKNFYGAYSLYVRSTNPNGFAFGIGGTSFASSANVITLGTWQHVAVTFDRSASSDQIRFYVNGNPAGVATYTNSIQITADDLYIGNNAALDRNFNGTIDEVKVWNRALTQAEIQASM